MAFPDAVIAEIAFVNLVRLCIIAGNVEGTGRNTFLAADALVLMNPHRSHRRVIEGAAGADLHAGRIGAVHAAVLPEEPFEISPLSSYS